MLSLTFVIYNVDENISWSAQNTLFNKI